VFKKRRKQPQLCSVQQALNAFVLAKSHEHPEDDPAHRPEFHFLVHLTELMGVTDLRPAAPAS
jgi:hypothetical protein